jgi:hypothetical protein
MPRGHSLDLIFIFILIGQHVARRDSSGAGLTSSAAFCAALLCLR